MQPFNFLIIGQGLAGSLLAYSLIKRGQRVLVLDNNHLGSATQVAAGLINPITGHRLNITDHFFTYSQAAKKMYWQIERDVDCQVYRSLPQTRLIKNAGQANYLTQRVTQADYSNLLDDIHNTGHWFADKTAHPFGAINVSQTAIVDTKRLLHSLHQWLTERGSVLSTKVEYSRINVQQRNVTYHHEANTLQANNIVFCEGYQALNNPWLDHLPFKPAKGEVLTVRPHQTLNRLLSWGKWLAPTSAGLAKLGSNYQWNDTSLSGDGTTAASFIQELENTTGLSADVCEHEVGIRPSTTHRKPFVGPLSKLSNAYCLNGLGSKGCLIAPHYVQLLCDHMLHDTNLPLEITQWL